MNILWVLTINSLFFFATRNFRFLYACKSLFISQADPYLITKYKSITFFYL